MPRWEHTNFTHEFIGKKEESLMAKRKVVNFTHEFVGEGQEELIEIFKRQFVRYVNEEKGFSYLTLKVKK